MKKGQFRLKASGEIVRGLQIGEELDDGGWGVRCWKELVEFFGPWSYAQVDYHLRERNREEGPRNGLGEDPGFYVRAHPEAAWFYPYFDDWLLVTREGKLIAVRPDHRCNEYARNEGYQTISEVADILMLY